MSQESEPTRVAVVTGASRGIGAAVADRLADLGFAVVGTAQTPSAADAVATRLRARGADATGIAVDVADPEAMAHLANAVADRYPAVDVLINNAGAVPEATAPRAPLADPVAVRQTLAVNLAGPMYVTDALLPLLRNSPAARIVNVSTRMGSLAEQDDPAAPFYAMTVPAYQAAKAGLNSLTISLAKLLSDTDIVVTSVCPGFVRTDLTPANKDAPLAPEQAAEVVVRAATAPAGAASGTFVDTSGPIRW